MSEAEGRLQTVLRELHISGLGVIDDLDLELVGGLNVLTGETGAGKTMVTVGLSLALGARASASMVASGASRARVQAKFDALKGMEDWTDEPEIVLARAVGSDGKTSARIGGQIATASALADLGGRLVEVHGQHQTQKLLGSATQTHLLDRFAGSEHAERVVEHQVLYSKLRATRSELDELTNRAREREREADLLEYQVREIEGAGVHAGELEALTAEEGRLANAERILELAASAHASLADDGMAADSLAAAATALAEAAVLDTDSVDLGERARALSAELAELARDVGNWRGGTALDPERLEEIRARLRELKSLQRKYGETESDIIAYLDESSRRLQELRSDDGRREELRASLGMLMEQVDAIVARISEGRRAAAPSLAGSLTDEINDLGMEGASVQVELPSEEPPNQLGAERAELMLSAGPNQGPKPLSKTASGGELSRTMLACRSVLADLDQVPTLVFDEVDAGIGGAAGLAVGRRLARLAESRQVIVVTHLPQIACFADLHLRVRKQNGRASVESVGDRERVDELARMLSGLPGEKAASHAEELLEEASRSRFGSDSPRVG
jgi:DNA repair protein RecN (Recombination protein N)